MGKKKVSPRESSRASSALNSVAKTPQAHPLVIEVVELLRERGQTVSFAESCSGGVLSAVLTRMPGISDVFAGSVVAYSYSVKERLLGIADSLLKTHGAVSIPVARKMASGGRKAMGTTWSVSITGIAGPGGGTERKPVGTVCFGISGPGIEEALQRRFSGSRREVQLASARFALRLLRYSLRRDSGLPRV